MFKPLVEAERLAPQAEPPFMRLTVTLTRSQAQDLLNMSRMIGGTEKSTRAVFDAIHDALEAQGLKHDDRSDDGSRLGRVSGGFSFTDI